MENSAPCQSPTLPVSGGKTHPPQQKSQANVKPTKSNSRKTSDKLKAKAIQKSARMDEKFASSRQRALEKQFSKAEKKMKASAPADHIALSPQQSPTRAGALTLSPMDTPSQVIPEATFTPTAAGLRGPEPQQDFMTGFQQMLESTLSKGFAGIQQTLQAIMVPQQQIGADYQMSISDSLSIQQGHDPNISDMAADSETSAQEEETRDQTLSDDEESVSDPPAFVGLFPPEIFKSLLTKAKATSELGTANTSQQGDSATTKTSQSLFSSQSPSPNFIPTPQLVMDVIKKQWQKPGSQPSPNVSDKKYYQGDQDIVNLLQLPKVEDPIVNVVSPSMVPGDAAEALKPEEKKLEIALRATYLAATWAIRSASAATFFNRATLLWLQQMETRVPASDTRLQQDLNKIKAATQFSADATLDSIKFSSRSLASSVASRRLLWLRSWQADVRSKWRLASGPFQGERLFGEIIDPLLIETKDKKKILPAQRKKNERRFQPYPRKIAQRSDFQTDQAPRPYYKRPERPQERYRDRYRPQNQSKRPFRGAGGRPFCKSR